jgi:N-acetylmuramoyl-L-alanine amidase
MWSPYDLPGKNFWQKSWFKLENKMAGKIHHLLALALLAALSGCSLFPKRATTRDTTKTFKTVVVDAGHGGKDNGAFRRYGGAEKIATLDVAKRLERKLRESQLKTVMTRSSDVFIPLDERVDIENSQKNSIFVSIHFNDSRRRGIHGFETYYNASNSRELADQIQNKLLTIERSANRGVHFANFRVLRLAKYPAVLVECGFLSNRREGGGARDSEFRELLADKIAEAIVEIRYGPGVYRATATATTENPPEPTGPGLAPATLRRD